MEIEYGGIKILLTTVGIPDEYTADLVIFIEEDIIQIQTKRDCWVTAI